MFNGAGGDAIERCGLAECCLCSQRTEIARRGP